MLKFSCSSFVLMAAVALGTFAPVAANAQPGGALIGKWSAGRVSSIQYRDSYTGVHAPTNGNHFAYEFRPDGTYSFTGLMQSVMYNCATAVFSQETGTYTTDGSTVSLRPEKNPYKMTYSCSPSSNREAPGKLINKTYRMRITQDGNNERLELSDGSGASPQVFTRSR